MSTIFNKPFKKQHGFTAIECGLVAALALVLAVQLAANFWPFPALWLRWAMFATLINLLRNKNGATAVEYGLIAALIAVAAITAFQTVGTNLTSVFTTVANKL
jgi:pilus assembly protein Flp/PilA